MKELACGHVVSDPSQTHYCGYLNLGALLGLQPEELRHPDEHLFVVAHQSFELWFKQMRLDMRRIIEALRTDDIPLSPWLVNRCVAILGMFSPMMRVLETMEPASGTESSGWHEVELLAGLRDEGFRRSLQADPSGDPAEGNPSRLWTARLEELWNEPSIASEFKRLLERRGVEPEDLYVVSPERNSNGDLMLLAKSLLDFDEEFRVWRFIHARTAQRAIGPATSGTGHTSGVSYLDYVATHRRDFFPELWRAREHLLARDSE